MTINELNNFTSYQVMFEFYYLLLRFFYDKIALLVYVLG